MANRDKSILEHVKNYCEEIGSFIERFGDDYNTFIGDRAYFNAVAMYRIITAHLTKNSCGKPQRKISPDC